VVAADVSAVLSGSFAVLAEVEPPVLAATLVLGSGVVLLADDVVSVLEADGLIEALPLIVLPLVDDVLPAADAGFADVSLLPLGLPDVVLGAGAVAAGVVLVAFSFLRSPIARALALPSAKTEIRNTGASLRIWSSLQFCWLEGRESLCNPSLQVPCQALSESTATQLRRCGTFYE